MKHDLQNVAPLFFVNFRPRAGAAPLKHPSPSARLKAGPTYFRPRAGAAPLKQLKRFRVRRNVLISAPARGRLR